MATESSSTPKVETEVDTATATATATNGESAEPTEQKRERRQHTHTPPEELYDLTKPIPKEEKPDKEAHDAEIEAINASIDTLKNTKNTIQTTIETALSGGRNSAAGQQREAIKKLRNKKGELINQKKVLQKTLEINRKQADNLLNDRKAAKATVRFSSVEAIEEEVQKLQSKQETTSMSLQEEKRLIKEIESLQKSKSTVAAFKATDASIDGVKEQRKNISIQLKAKDVEIDAVQVEIEEKQKVLDEMKNTEDELRKNLDGLKKERDSLRKEIGDKMDERNAVRKTFQEKNNKWYDYQRAIKAQKKIKYEEEKKKREEEDKTRQLEWEAEEAKKIPYEEEQESCQHLADYLQRTYLTEEGKSGAADTKKDDFVAVKDDPFANFKPRKKSEDTTYLQVGKGKKKPRVRASKKNSEPTFTLTVDMFEQFGVLGLKPPVSLDGVQQAVDNLKAKKEWYSKQARGSVPTANDIRKANVKAAQQQKDSTGSKKNGKLDISSDDFAPLSAGSSSTAMNATWGQKPVEVEATVEESATDTVEELVAEAVVEASA